MIYPQNSQMALRFAKKQTRSVPVSVIGTSNLKTSSTSYQAPQVAQSNQYTAPEKPTIVISQPEIQPVIESTPLPVQENIISQEDQAKIDKYNQDLKTYNEELNAYNKAKADYDAQLAAYNKEKDDWYLAQKLIDTGREYAASGDPSVKSKIKFLVKANAAARNAQFKALEQGTPVPTQFTYASGGYSTKFNVASPVTEQIQLPTIPEGFQGVSDPNAPNGFRLEKIPTTSSGYQVISAPTVYPTVQDLITPPTTPLTPYLENPVSPTMTQTQTSIPQNVIGISTSQAIVPEKPTLQEFMQPPSNPLTNQIGQSVIPNVESKTYSDFTSGGRIIGGTIDYLAEKSKSFIGNQPISYSDYKPYQLRGTFVDYSPEQKQQIINLKTEQTKQGIAQTVQTAPYLVPVGGALFALAKGTESLVTPGGRAETQKNINLQSTSTGKIIAKAQPLLDIAFGVTGSFSIIKSARTAQLSKNAETILLSREGLPIESKSVFNTENNILDTITAKKTSPTWLDKNLLGIEPEVQVSRTITQIDSGAEGLIGIEGKGYSFKYNPVDKRLAEFPIGNVIEKPGTAKTIIKEFKTFNIEGTGKLVNGEVRLINPKSTLGETEQSISKIYIKTNEQNPQFIKKNLVDVSSSDNNFVDVISSDKLKQRVPRDIMPSDLDIRTFRGQTARSEVKIITPQEESGFTFIQGTKPVKTESFANQFNSLDQISFVKQAPKPTSFAGSISKASEGTIRPTSAKSILEELPKASIYSGTGTYERYSTSENLIVPKVKVVNKELGGTQFSNLNVGNTNFAGTAPSGKIESLGSTGRFNDLGTSKSRLDISNPGKPIQKPVQSLETQTKQKQNSINNLNINNEDQNIKIKLKSNQDLIQPQKQKQHQNQTPAQPITPTTTTILITTTPRIPIPRIPILPRFKKSSQDKKKELMNKAYDVLRRKKGKIEVIGKNLTYNRALKLGSSKVKSDLTQTFALRESGYTNQEDIGYSLNKLFTTPKLSKTKITRNTFVERRGFTLTTGSERSLFKKSRLF